MPACCALGCSNRSSGKTLLQREKEKKKTITFHKFSRNPERRAAWTKALRRADWEPSNTSILCSEHFTEESFDRTSLSCVRLRENAVPSIFPLFPTYFQKKDKPLRSKYVRSSDVTVTVKPILVTKDPSTSQETSTSTAVPECQLRLPTSNISTAVEDQQTGIKKSISHSTSISPVNRMQRELPSTKASLLEKICDMKIKYRKKIILTQQTRRRYIKKVATLTNVLTSLKNHEKKLEILQNIASST